MRVILISLKAGGVALNLTVASRIFLMDPWWNPAAEYQASTVYCMCTHTTSIRPALSIACARIPHLLVQRCLLHVHAYHIY